MLVVGGGPIGLRAACEMALLGHQVTLFEKRDNITRLNVIKLWQETANDLDSLGLSSFDTKYHNQSDLKASTSRLQLVLIKAALLLGVRICVGSAVDLDRLSEQDADVVLLASGAKSQEPVEVSSGSPTGLLGLGFNPGTQSGMESNCIAVVAHFERTGEWQKCFAPPGAEIQWTYKDCAKKAPEVLQKMQEVHGPHAVAPDGLDREHIYLEQFLCYVNRAGPEKGKEGVPSAFYVIFTFRQPTRENGSQGHTLREWEYAAPDGTRRKLIRGMDESKHPRELLEEAIKEKLVDKEALTALVKTVVAHFTEPYTRDHRYPRLKKTMSEACAIIPDSVSIFDFSARQSLKEAYKVNDCEGGQKQLLLPIGDALQEPFWVC